jgi:hypothetical protein
MRHGLDIICAVFVGYQWGRNDRGARLLNWAEDAITPGWRTWRFWPAAPIVIAVIAWLWIAHPRRTLANRRSWKNADTSAM